MSSTVDLSGAEWVKSSYSNGGGGGCVEWAPEIAAVSDLIPVRDSKDPDGPAILFRPAAWSSFVSAVREQTLPTR
ncbi:DUF397 domain-containing protein [Streptomyces malaysiensis]|uniref:DUF397 domain-containing protein n=1 Tax=Streptomyces malaysiensis TaxID=92644 RepID=UPI00142F1243|nr:DUF397 domain-containing protein [Streptomyces malaysiensis]